MYEVSGDALRDALYRKGVKQKTLASLIGVTPYQVSRWMKGVNKIRTVSFERTAKVLSIDVEELARVCRPSPQNNKLFLASDELALVEKYRDADVKTKGLILTCVEVMAEGRASDAAEMIQVFTRKAPPRGELSE